MVLLYIVRCHTYETHTLHHLWRTTMLMLAGVCRGRAARLPMCKLHVTLHGPMQRTGDSCAGRGQQHAVEEFQYRSC